MVDLPQGNALQGTELTKLGIENWELVCLAKDGLSGARAYLKRRVFVEGLNPRTIAGDWWPGTREHAEKR